MFSVLFYHFFIYKKVFLPFLVISFLFYCFTLNRCSLNFTCQERISFEGNILSKSHIQTIFGCQKSLFFNKDLPTQQQKHVTPPCPPTSPHLLLYHHMLSSTELKIRIGVDGWRVTRFQERTEVDRKKLVVIIILFA